MPMPQPPKPAPTRPAAAPRASPAKPHSPEQEHLLGIIVGPSGSGKSSFCAEFPKPCFITDQLDTGIVDLMSSGAVDAGKAYHHPETIEYWSRLLEIIESYRNNHRGFKTFVFEGVTGFERLCWAHGLANEWGNDAKDFMNFSKGPKWCARELWGLKLLVEMKRLRASGVNVLMTAHTREKDKLNIGGDDFVGSIPYCDSETWQQTHANFELIAFMAMNVTTKKSGVRSKAVGEYTRSIIAHKHPTFDGKNRRGVQQAIHFEGGPEDAYQKFCEGMRIDPAKGY